MVTPSKYDQIAKMEQERRDWLTQHYYEDHGDGMRPYDASKLSRQDVFDKYREVQHFAEQGRVEHLSDSQVLETWGKAPIAPSSAGTKGPSGRKSTEKYLEKHWDKSNFGSIKKSINYQVGKHGKGLSEAEYTQRALKAFADPSAISKFATDKMGRSAVQVVFKRRQGTLHATGKNHMVSTKEIAELKEQYEALTKRSIDLDDYTGPLFQVVFEIITADTFVAGISSKILDGDPIEPEERVVLASPLLERDRWWRSDDGQLIDLQEYSEVREYALGLERLRQKANQVLR